MLDTNSDYRSGFVALIGSPNVGKSTLLNRLVGQKVAIVSSKAQTTRNKVVGIMTKDDLQIVFLDTPGLHTPKTKLGQYMVKTAQEAQRDVDLTLMIVDAKIGLLERDRDIAKNLPGGSIAVVNKADAVSEHKVQCAVAVLKEQGVREIAIISALTGDGCDELLERIQSVMPEGPQYYPEDMVTDRPERFIAAEILREKALENLKEEVPHGLAIDIEKIEELEHITNVAAVIFVERTSHKGIVIGKGGKMLKKIASEARVDLQMLFGTKVFLEVFVKVGSDWRNNIRMLKELGYKD